MLILNVWATNEFLSGKFMTYGTDVVKHYSKTYDERKQPGSDDPICDAFPTVVGCTFSAVGSGSGKETENAICILSQNIINEKIYLFLWFWLAFLGLIGGFQFIFEVAALSMPAFRSWITTLQIGPENEETNQDIKSIRKRREGTKRYIESLNVGDWYILYQI